MYQFKVGVLLSPPQAARSADERASATARASGRPRPLLCRPRPATRTLLTTRLQRWTVWFARDTLCHPIRSAGNSGITPVAPRLGSQSQLGRRRSHLPAALRCSAGLPADSNGCPKLRTSSVSGDFGMLKQDGGSCHEPGRSADRPSAACEGEAKLSEPDHVVDRRDRTCVWCGRCPVAAVPLAARADKCRPAADTGVVRLSNADWTFGSPALPRTRAGRPIRSHVRCAQTGIRGCGCGMAATRRDRGVAPPPSSPLRLGWRIIANDLG